MKETVSKSRAIIFEIWKILLSKVIKISLSQIKILLLLITLFFFIVRFKFIISFLKSFINHHLIINSFIFYFI
jgi:hypothetical protein